MARRAREPIEVHSWVTVNGQEVEVSSLSPEMRRKVATELKLRYLNTLFRGEAVFWAAEEV